jgi:two-component system copper resistance phosphate regulon response regulator CusR
MKLLLVEDDSALVTAVGRGLRSAGYAVDTARNGEECARLLRLGLYDVMVLDLGLPDVDGLVLLRRLRAERLATPVLVLTARDQLTDRITGLDAGADDYLQKPFAFPELLARLRALLRRGVPVASTILRVADLELDPARVEVRRRGQALSLTTKEFAILEYFMRHAGELVTRTMLLDGCWDSSYEGLSNLVDVHVGRLRRKLDVPGAQPLLHTVRGAGFLLGERTP